MGWLGKRSSATSPPRVGWAGAVADKPAGWAGAAPGVAPPLPRDPPAWVVDQIRRRWHGQRDRHDLRSRSCRPAAERMRSATSSQGECPPLGDKATLGDLAGRDPPSSGRSPALLRTAHPRWNMEGAGDAKVRISLLLEASGAIGRDAVRRAS